MSTYDYSDTINFVSAMLDSAEHGMVRVSESISERVESGDYYVSDLVSHLSVFESSVAYLKHVLSVLRRATDDTSPLELMVSAQFSGVDERMEKGRNRYGETVVQELLLVERAAKNN